MTDPTEIRRCSFRLWRQLGWATEEAYRLALPTEPLTCPHEATHCAPCFDSGPVCPHTENPVCPQHYAWLEAYDRALEERGVHTFYHQQQEPPYNPGDCDGSCCDFPWALDQAPSYLEYTQA